MRTSVTVRASFKTSHGNVPIPQQTYSRDVKQAPADPKASICVNKSLRNSQLHQNRPLVQLRRAMEQISVTSGAETGSTQPAKTLTRTQRDELEVAQSYRPEMEQQGMRSMTLPEGTVVRRSARSSKAPERYIDTYGFEIFKRYTMNNKGEVDVDPALQAVLMAEYNARKQAADLRRLGQEAEAREILQRLEASRLRSAAIAAENKSAKRTQTLQEEEEEREDDTLEGGFVVVKRKCARADDSDSDGDYEQADSSSSSSASSEEEEEESDDDEEEEEESEEEEEEEEDDEDDDDDDSYDDDDDDSEEDSDDDA